MTIDNLLSISIGREWPAEGDEFIALCNAVDQDELRRRIKEMDYRDFLSTVYWRKIRDMVLVRDGCMCRACSSTHSLRVHHNDKYKSHGAEHNHLLCLSCLCDPCHKLFHGIEERPKPEEPIVKSRPYPQPFVTSYGKNVRWEHEWVEESMPRGDPIKIDKKNINLFKTRRGGFNAATIRALTGTYPPTRRWLKELRGKYLPRSSVRKAMLAALLGK